MTSADKSAEAVTSAMRDARRETLDVHMRDRTPHLSRLTSQKRAWMLALLLIATIGGIAWWRVGLLDLPPVPPGLTAEASGLVGLEDMKRLHEAIWSTSPTSGAVAGDPALSEAASWVQRGIGSFQRGDVPAALEDMRRGIRLDPHNLVLANAYRVVVFRCRRDFLQNARRQLAITPQFPPELHRQPIQFLEELDRAHATRETRLQLALAWVDEMLLFPALEIKAPASVQSVDLLTEVLEGSAAAVPQMKRDAGSPRPDLPASPGYIPALMARGLNHLHRPSRLVWPESSKTLPDAAARDIGTCVAIGGRFGGVSPRVQSTLAMILGDAYVKAGRLGVARSWWQIAQNLCHEDDLQAAIHRRYGWHDDEILDRLDEELDRSRSELDHPMTDLSWVWN